MSLRINEVAPNFVANTTHGEINLHKWLGKSWGLLFSHPKDFTPVCTTELAYLAKIEPEFIARGVKLIGLSVDSVKDHDKWKEDVYSIHGKEVNYPIIADDNLQIAKLYNMLPADEIGEAKDRTAVNNATVRSVFIIGPDKRIKLILAYPMTTGRNFDEILRVIDSMQLTVNHKVATPANWKNGEDVIIVPAVSNEEAKSLFPNGWNEVKSYLRFVKQPN